MPTPRIFFVHFRFQSAGDVFTDGLRHAAEQIGIDAEHADWNVFDVGEQISRFAPDLVFVVHGRKFATRLPQLGLTAPTAVWLVDEPYETDDTAKWSSRYGTAFSTDASTLHRHHNANYLPAAFDPYVHSVHSSKPRAHRVGFVGNANPDREAALLRLMREDLLSYVVGAGWRSQNLQSLCLAPKMSPVAVADLYRKTKIVLNVFRPSLGHLNRQAILGVSASPRVYEALACGAVVVSEWRSGLDELPMVATFRTDSDLVNQVKALLGDEARRAVLQAQWRQQAHKHSYAERLRQVINIAGVQPK